MHFDPGFSREPRSIDGEIGIFFGEASSLTNGQRRKSIRQKYFSLDGIHSFFARSEPHELRDARPDPVDHIGSAIRARRHNTVESTAHTVEILGKRLDDARVLAESEDTDSCRAGIQLRKKPPGCAKFRRKHRTS